MKSKVPSPVAKRASVRVSVVATAIQAGECDAILRDAYRHPTSTVSSVSNEAAESQTPTLFWSYEGWMMKKFAQLNVEQQRLCRSFFGHTTLTAKLFATTIEAMVRWITILHVGHHTQADTYSLLAMCSNQRDARRVLALRSAYTSVAAWLSCIELARVAIFGSSLSQLLPDSPLGNNERVKAIEAGLAATETENQTLHKADFIEAHKAYRNEYETVYGRELQRIDYVITGASQLSKKEILERILTARYCYTTVPNQSQDNIKAWGSILEKDRVTCALTNTPLTYSTCSIHILRSERGNGVILTHTNAKVQRHPIVTTTEVTVDESVTTDVTTAEVTVDEIGDDMTQETDTPASVQTPDPILINESMDVDEGDDGWITATRPPKRKRVDPPFAAVSTEQALVTEEVIESSPKRIKQIEQTLSQPSRSLIHVLTLGRRNVVPVSPIIHALQFHNQTFVQRSFPNSLRTAWSKFEASKWSSFMHLLMGACNITEPTAWHTIVHFLVGMFKEEDPESPNTLYPIPWALFNMSSCDTKSMHELCDAIWTIMISDKKLCEQTLDDKTNTWCTPEWTQYCISDESNPSTHKASNNRLELIKQIAQRITRDPLLSLFVRVVFADS